MHGSDFSRASARALRVAIALVRANPARLTIAHVLTPVVPVGPVAGEGYIPPASYAQIEASARAAAVKQLDRLIAKARAAGVRATGLLLSGTPHDQLARALKSRRADLAVIGTHGRTGIARFFLGSVASRLVAVAPCPVLTVRGG
jgi:nucleotide-binding universal stress UspA family protein